MIGNDMNGLTWIAMERRRRVEGGRDPAGDWKHERPGTLADFASHVAARGGQKIRADRLGGGWDGPNVDPVQLLAVAGAMIAAQIDVLLYDSWQPVPGTANLKACPACGDVTLEGFTECTECGHQPADDDRWRNEVTGVPITHVADADLVQRLVSYATRDNDPKRGNDLLAAVERIIQGPPPEPGEGWSVIPSGELASLRAVAREVNGIPEPYQRDFVGRMDWNDDRAFEVESVEVDGVKVDDVVALDDVEGWADAYTEDCRYLRRHYGRITITWKDEPTPEGGQ